MSLTPKQAAFVAAYLVDSNGKKAAIKAGYSKAGAEVAASRLLRHPKVAEALKQARQPAAESPQRAPEPSFDLSTALQHQDSMSFLRACMNDTKLDMKQRIDSAKALLPYEKQRLGEGGKKEERNEAAKKVASRFAAAAPPKLVAAGGKKV